MFEGTHTQMFASLMRLAALPDETLVYCGHEYTEANLQFAKLVEPINQDLLKRIDQAAAIRSKNLPTVPALLAEEKLTNPFLRCHVPEVIQAVEKHTGQKLNDPIKIFESLRKWKNSLS